MKEQLEQQKQKIEDEMFYEQMKDFMDWKNYRNLENKLHEVNAKLEALN